MSRIAIRTLQSADANADAPLIISYVQKRQLASADGQRVLAVENPSCGTASSGRKLSQSVDGSELQEGDADAGSTEDYMWVYTGGWTTASTPLIKVCIFWKPVPESRGLIASNCGLPLCAIVMCGALGSGCVCDHECLAALVHLHAFISKACLHNRAVLPRQRIHDRVVVHFEASAIDWSCIGI